MRVVAAMFYSFLYKMIGKLQSLVTMIYTLWLKTVVRKIRWGGVKYLTYSSYGTVLMCS